MNDLRSRVNHIETMLETLVQATTHLSPRSTTASNVPQPAASSSLPAVPAVSDLCRSTNDAREATPPLRPVQPSRPSAPRSIDVQLESLSPGTTRDGVAPEYEQFQASVSSYHSTWADLFRELKKRMAPSFRSDRRLSGLRIKRAAFRQSRRRRATTSCPETGLTGRATCPRRSI